MLQESGGAAVSMVNTIAVVISKYYSLVFMKLKIF